VNSLLTNVTIPEVLNVFEKLKIERLDNRIKLNSGEVTNLLEVYRQCYEQENGAAYEPTGDTSSSTFIYEIL